MKINTGKSSIGSNLTKGHIDHPTIKTFYIGNEPIKTIIGRCTTIKFLGVHWSLDGNYTKTFNHTKAHLQYILNTIRPKYLPGDISKYLINTVIIPQLKYRLQLIHVRPSEFEEINTKLRKLYREKTNIPTRVSNTRTYILQLCAST